MKEKGCGFLPTPMASQAMMFTNGNMRAEETWETVSHLSHYLIGMEYNLKGREKCQEKNICVHPLFAEWMMGWPETWTELKPLEMDKYQQWLNWHGKS